MPPPGATAGRLPEGHPHRPSRSLPRIIWMNASITVELDAQYRQLREECGLLDRFGRGKLLVSGPDAAEYLQGQLTNDVEALEPGDGQYSALLDRKGHMQADMRVLRPEPEEIWIDTEPEAIAATRRHLEMYSIGRDVKVGDVGAERAILSLIGPRSVEIAGTAALPENSCEASLVAGVECLGVGTRNGIDLIVAAGEAERLRDALLGAGAVAVAPQAVEILRIEQGVPRFGAEMGTETMPAEAGIVEAAVSFTKGCYIGQETVARLHYKGRPNRHLRGLRLSAPAAPGTPLLLGEKEVGKLGGAAVSPALGAIGLTILRREAEPGAELALGEDGVTARVVDLPFG
jgi:folate-binding protein YgfZ